MLIDDINGILSGSAKFIGVILLVLVAFCVGPFLAIFAVNFIAEIGGSDFYIKHGFLNYLSVFVVLCVFRAMFR